MKKQVRSAHAKPNLDIDRPSAKQSAYLKHHVKLIQDKNIDDLFENQEVTSLLDKS